MWERKFNFQKSYSSKLSPKNKTNNIYTKKMREKIIYSSIILALSVFCCQNALAYTEVINNITSSANSGDNSSDGGSIESGDATASAKVENHVGGNDDGIKVKSEIKLKTNEKEYEEKVESNEDVDLEKKLENDGGKAQVQLKTKILNDERSDTTSEPPTQEEKNEAPQKNLLGKIVEFITSIFK